MTTVLSILAAVTCSVYACRALEWAYLPWLLVAACAAHVSVNVLNDYEDFQSGLDFHTIKTPFSGGSGALIDHPEAEKNALRFSRICLVLVCLVGFYLVYARGLPILAFGVLGCLLVLSYTRWLTRNPLLCFMAPGFGCGVLMILGSQWVLTGSLSAGGFLTAAIFFCLYNNLLLLNQFPDIDADRQAGRRHYPIAIGRKKSLMLYLATGLTASGLILLACLYRVFPRLTLLALPVSLGCLVIFVALQRHAGSWERLLSALRWNTAHILVTASCLPVTMLLALRCV
jgi:1,4-dihydroxy-2-naphthoate octaprenyltransferase